MVGDLKKMPEIYKLAAISGTYDLMAEVGAESTERIDRALARWEADQLQRGIRMNDLGVSLGNRIMNIVR